MPTDYEALKRWRKNHPEAYRTYMRNYMRKKRKTPPSRYKVRHVVNMKWANQGD